MAALTPALIALHNPLCMLFLFGPSPLRPVEVYSLSCETAQLPDDGGSAISERADEEVARDMSRRVLRSLIMHTAGGPEGKAASGKHQCPSHDWSAAVAGAVLPKLTLACSGPTKLFVMVRAPEHLSGPPGFLPKRTFQMRQRRGLQVRAPDLP